jgi:hypothetical protein
LSLELAGLGALAIAVVSGLAIGGLLIVRRLMRIDPENEVAGLLFSAVGVVYGALLAFIVFATWESYSNAEQAVAAEAAQLVAVYRDTQVFPEPQRHDVQDALRKYTNQVMNLEWTSHGKLLPHTNPDLLNPVWTIYRAVVPSTPRDEARLAAAEERLHELELQRHARHLSGEGTLPPVFWPVLLLGGGIAVVFSYFFYQTSLRAQALMTGAVAALLGTVLLLIVTLNQPFTGPLPVSQQPFVHALLMFHAIDLEPPGP